LTVVQGDLFWLELFFAIDFPYDNALPQFLFEYPTFFFSLSPVRSKRIDESAFRRAYFFSICFFLSRLSLICEIHGIFLLLFTLPLYHPRSPLPGKLATGFDQVSPLSVAL